MSCDRDHNCARHRQGNEREGNWDKLPGHVSTEWDPESVYVVFNTNPMYVW